MTFPSSTNTNTQEDLPSSSSPFHLGFHLPHVSNPATNPHANPPPPPPPLHISPSTSSHTHVEHTIWGAGESNPYTFSSLVPTTATTMGNTKAHLDIILDSQYLTLKGTGPDVEPTTLSGHVALHLTESTSIKEITLQFRGKAKIPMPASESLINSGTFISYIVCSHDWSFLEGDKRHSRTLKAGRHFFPFSLNISGSLPSSISTNALGGASVAYKLRAVALRTGLSHNLHAIAPVHILRSFTHEALEYQQTLEIENTWPDKLMYAIMLPHKAWAAGDTLAAVLKFSPLAKGVRVSSIVSSLYETTKVYARSGAQDDTRVVCSVRHEIVGGRAVEVDLAPERPRLPAGFVYASPSATRPNSRPASRPASPLGHRNVLGIAGSSSSSADHHQHHDADHAGDAEHNATDEDEFENHEVVTYIKLLIPPSSPPPSSVPTTPSHATSPTGFAFAPPSSSSRPSRPPRL
ncbi:hypothetical protein BDZ97DRAFT_2071472 [Flammula alnicola]|nr:hypothetical protein BDZ97DRAFT_2071472 [Flammula alnicola]